MKLRYYLRGLGIGIVVTALIMGITGKDSVALTDAEIKAKAYELGMVEGDSIKLSDLQPTASARPSDTAPPEAARTPEATAEPTVTEKPEATAKPTVTEKPEATKAPEGTAKPSVTNSPAATENPAAGAPDGVAVVVIMPGADSYSVSRQLEELGLVPDAGAYDRYLCDNGYSTTISIGTYEIALGADEEQIAKIITKSR